MSLTGFNSFWIYNAVKYVHFNGKKSNILEKLPRREVYLNKWNEEMINRRDSMYFFKLDEMFLGKKENLIRCYAYYYIRNKQFYVTEIFDEDFKLYKDMEWELEHIKVVIENDFLKIMIYALEQKKKLDEIFKSTSLSDVFYMYDKKTISIRTLMALEKSFKMLEKLDRTKLNIIEKNKIEKYEKIFEKYYLIVYKYFEFDIKDYLKNTYIKIRKESK